MTGAFSWAKLDYGEDRRKTDRRGIKLQDRRGGERRITDAELAHLSSVAEIAVIGGKPEEEFVKEFLPHRRTIARMAYRNASHESIRPGAPDRT